MKKFLSFIISFVLVICLVGCDILVPTTKPVTTSKEATTTTTTKPTTTTKETSIVVDNLKVLENKEKINGIITDQLNNLKESEDEFVSLSNSLDFNLNLSITVPENDFSVLSEELTIPFECIFELNTLFEMDLRTGSMCFFFEFYLVKFNLPDGFIEDEKVREIIDGALEYFEGDPSVPGYENKVHLTIHYQDESIYLELCDAYNKLFEENILKESISESGKYLIDISSYLEAIRAEEGSTQPEALSNIEEVGSYSKIKEIVDSVIKTLTLLGAIDRKGNFDLDGAIDAIVTLILMEVDENYTDSLDKTLESIHYLLDQVLSYVTIETKTDKTFDIVSLDFNPLLLEFTNKEGEKVTLKDIITEVFPIDSLNISFQIKATTKDLKVNQVTFRSHGEGTATISGLKGTLSIGTTNVFKYNTSLLKVLSNEDKLNYVLISEEKINEIISSLVPEEEVK